MGRVRICLFIRYVAFALSSYTWICTQPTELTWWLSGAMYASLKAALS